MWESTQELQISLQSYDVEGAYSGLLQDIKFRPNRYFHPIEEVLLQPQHVEIKYQRPFQPLGSEDRFSLAQIKELVLALIDARQRMAPHQIFYIADHEYGFCLNEKGQLRIGLLNVKPKQTPTTNGEKRIVERLLDLIAGHSPDTQKKINSYGKPIHSLRQLHQILSLQSRHRWLWSVFFLFLLGGGVTALLSYFGPPKIKGAIQTRMKSLKSTSLGFFKSGTDEWYDQLQQERRKKDYRFPPMRLTLILNIQADDGAQKQKLFLAMHKLLTKEFSSTKYKLSIPHPNLSVKAYQRWTELCKTSFANKCTKDSWLLELEAYRGGARPLVDMLKEAMQSAKLPLQITPTFHSMVGLLTVKAKVAKKDSKQTTSKGKLKEKQTSKAPTNKP